MSTTTTPFPDTLARTFPSLSRRELRRLGALATVVSVPPGTVVFRRGAPARELCWVADGHLDVVVDGTVVASATPGTPVGELALLPDGQAAPSRTRSADVVAPAGATLVVSSAAELSTLVADCPALAASLEARAAELRG